MSSTLRRGLFHLVSGLVIPLAALFLPRTILLISLGAVTFTLLGLELIRLRVPAVNRLFFSLLRPLLREKEATRLTGASYTLIASLISFLVFQRDIAVLALSFLAVGDPMATMVGKQIGRRGPQGKTLEGDLACLIACVVTGLVFYLADLDVPLLTIMLGAVIATVAEAIPSPLNDNLTIPLLGGLAMRLVPI